VYTLYFAVTNHNRAHKLFNTVFVERSFSLSAHRQSDETPHWPLTSASALTTRFDRIGFV